MLDDLPPHHYIPGEVYVGKVPVAPGAGHDRPTDPPHAPGNGSPSLRTRVASCRGWAAGSRQNIVDVRGFEAHMKHNT